MDDDYKEVQQFLVVQVTALSMAVSALLKQNASDKLAQGLEQSLNNFMAEVRSDITGDNAKKLELCNQMLVGAARPMR